MKKLLLLFSFTIIAFATQAQNDNPITFGIIGGENLAVFQIKSPVREYISSAPSGPWGIGFTADYKLNDYFSIRPGIVYAGKGGSPDATYVDANSNNVSVSDNYRLHYLEVPVNLIGRLPLGDNGANIFLGAGPYFAYALNGTNQQSFELDDTMNEKITFGKNGDFKSTDFGATTVLGFTTARGVVISANIDFGLTNILQTNNSGFDASEFKTVTFYFGVGQNF
jgi:energy-coupling factor transporter transmembrane protein EcfT